MVFDWNKVINGLVSGGTQVAGAMFDRQDRLDADKTYENANESLNELIGKYKNSRQNVVKDVPKEQTTDNSINRITSEPATVDGKPSSGYTIKKEPVDVNQLYDTFNKFEGDLTSNYGEHGKKYAKMLGDSFTRLMADEDTKILEWNGNAYTYKLSDIEGTIAPLLTKPEKIEKEKPFQLSPDAEIIQLGDGSYGWAEPDPKSEGGWKFTGVKPTQDQLDQFLQTGKYTKKTGTKSGTKKGGQVQLTQEAKTLGGSLKKLGELNKGFGSMNEEDRKQYEDLKAYLIPYFGNDWDKLNLYAEKIFKATDKQIPAILEDVLGLDNVEEAEEELDLELADDEIEAYDLGLQVIDPSDVEGRTLAHKQFMKSAKTEEAKTHARKKYIEYVKKPKGQD